MAAARMRGAMAAAVLRLPMFGAGMPARERLLAQLSPAARAWMLAPLLPTEWFDEAFAVELSNAVMKTLHITDPAAIQQWFRRWHVQAFAGTFRQMTGARDPKGFAAVLPGFWTRQHDTGAFEIVALREGYLHTRLRGNANATDRVYAIALAGGMEAFLTMVGAQGVRATHTVGRLLLDIESEWDGIASLPDEG